VRKKPRDSTGTERARDAVRKFAGIGMNQQQIAEALNLTKSTISDVYGEEYHAGKADLTKKLRGKQVRVAMEGNVPMLIWLGKIVLGDRDTQQIDHTTGDKPIRGIVGIDPDSVA
jgi:hypothetical protein